MKHSLMVVLFLLGLSVSGFAQKSKSEVSSCTELPCVVATFSVTNQSAKVAETPLYTPTGDGTFRISVYMSTSADVNTAAHWEALFGWTDEVKRRIGGLADLHQNTYASLTMVANDVAGQSLSYAVAPHGAGGFGGSDMTYSLTIVVEQLR